MNNKRPPKPPAIRPEDAAKGAAAETTFAQWLDASEVAAVYLDQSKLTMPAHLRGKFKRVDYLVGIAGTGIIAFDVKAKSIFDGALIFDLDEIKKTRVFARQFHLTVYFACLDPAGGDQGFWVRLDQLDFARVVTRAGKQTVACPVERAMAFSMQYNFDEAFLDAKNLI